MLKILFFLLSMPFSCLAQVSISGKIINQSDAKPLPNASVFLSNSTIGTKTANDGRFSLSNLQPGKYELVVSVIGFESYSHAVTVGQTSIQLGDIILSPKTIALKEVSIRYHKDPDREKYLNWFKEEFLGTTERAKDCRILNPEMLDLSYNDADHKLSASSADYLEIENDALGYKIRYLITDFSLEQPADGEKKISYKGPVRFEELKGTPSQKTKWLKNREQLYENSPIHFLRSVLNNKLTEEGFRVQKQVSINNPNRPSDSLINARVIFFTKAKKQGVHFASDSLSAWVKLSKLPKATPKTITLTSKELLVKADQPVIYILGADTGKLYVAYNKKHRLYVKNSSDYLYNANNDELTLIVFNSPAFFYSNGAIVNPYSVTYYGVWGRNRVAELLPIDYSPSADKAEEYKLPDDLTAKIDTFISNHHSEKTYLQFDKPYYASGDTIYFKAYVASANLHILSTLSGVLHVDLISPDNIVKQSLKLHLDSGITWGDFALPDSLLKGNYHIRAYTMLMQPDGTLIPFDKVIPVGSLMSAKAPERLLSDPSQHINPKPDVQFSPEGGRLATGIRSKVAFKAIGANSIGVSVKGVVEDGNGKMVVAFSSAHLGMGCFYLLPEAGKTYVAKIDFPNGEKEIVNLPHPEGGILLSVQDSDDRKMAVNITSNKDGFEANKNKNYILLILSGGATTTVNFKLNQPAVTLEIEKSKLHTGVATITLFSDAYEPLAERLVFIDNYDQLNIKVADTKSEFAKREKVKLNLAVSKATNSPVKGHFSVSVINESLIPTDTKNSDNILTYFLLTSDLKGYVEQPDYYFSDTGISAKENLDLLMLTQGFRRFEWKAIFTDKESVAPRPEKGLEINGIVKNLAGKPVIKGTVNLIKPEGGMLSSITDNKGEFHFSDLIFTDTANFVLSAVNAAGKNSTKISLYPPGIQPAFKTYSPNLQGQPDSAMTRYLVSLKNRPVQQRYDKKGTIMLKEVKIKAIKRDDKYATQSFAGAGHADQVLHSKDLLGGPLSTSMYLLKGVTIVKKGVASVPYLTLNLMSATQGKNPGPMLVIVDGAIINDPKSPPDINLINTNDVETVEVLKYASTSAYGMNGGDGVLIITTKQGGGLNYKDVKSVGVLPIKVAGFYKAREFYAPKYDNKTLTSTQRDYRSTIYWQPEVTTGKNGTASIEYYNAGEAGRYKVIIEGMDENGNIGRMVYSYSVE